MPKIDVGTLSLHKSERYDRMWWVQYELNGERHIISRVLFNIKDTWQTMPKLFLAVNAKPALFARVSEAFAPQALSIVRGVSEYNDTIFGAADEEQEAEQVARIREALLAALPADDAFCSTQIFCSKLRISGCDDLYFAFYKEFRPALEFTDKELLASARHMEDELKSEHKEWAQDIEKVLSSDEQALAPR
ncbi:hypothetical protein [Mesorhizobium sp. SP-1A]|uniref:hypothetical protein n=1 Tax=Mesorhizobium sp. SP-1A TaxID=3077840 RepID=UPI0028F7276D|nr:hypothetical protein [Mesorhizobium sp. SP-1A]